MKNKIFSVLVGLLAVFLGACSDDDDVLTTSSVHVNGGPLEESITPTSARVRIRLNETAGIGEVGICYGVQTDKSALLSYGDVLKVEKVDSVMYLDLTELESATTYSYVAYAKYENASVADVHSVVRSFTTQSADLYLTPSRLNRSATGRLDTVKITTTFDFWAVAEYDYDWITYEKKDTLLILKTQDNSGAEIRSAILKIQAGSRTQSLAVMQAAPTISLSADTLEVSAKGATGSFIVRSDVAWSIDKDADWVTCSVEKDSIVNFTAEVNTGSEERFGHITVSVSDQLYKIFTVAQRSGALAVTKTNLSYGLKGGEEGFVVECNTDDWTFSSDKSWCKPEWIQGTDSIAVRVDPNDTEAAVRTATITVQKEQSVKKVTVSQESGLMLSDVSLENLVFWGGNGDIKVKAYTDSWTVESVTDDFTASRTNDSIVTVSVANLNTTAQEITGSVTIKAGNLTQTMTLVQPCAVIDWGTEEVKFSYTGGTKSNTSGNYIGMTKYKVEGTGVSWLTVGSEGVSFVQGTDGYMVVAGEDDAFVTLNLTATANNTGKTRTATITGVWEGVTESFTVTQMDASSVVVLPALEAGVLAGNYTLTEEGYTGYVHFGDKIYTKAEYDEITTELEAAGTSLYDDRYAKFRAVDYDYAMGLDNGNTAYPLLFKINQVESTADGAPSGAYEVEIVTMYEPVNTALESDYIAYYDKNTKTLYFEFDYYSWASGQTEHCIRTLVFAE
ncbi:BACON domain-containing protein [Odoribacter splanchnicus]|uniref:BACON domain-containing protein n=1 Tax=Odoribacter splanchnicus TaxID=28118 RepID=UPI0015FE4A23|nr:BACON domain-containing protein [Odoribacter splanchnicus]